MKQSDKQTMAKYLKYQYWTKYLQAQGHLSEQEAARLLSMIRVRCGIS